MKTIKRNVFKLKITAKLQMVGLDANSGFPFGKYLQLATWDFLRTFLSTEITFLLFSFFEKSSHCEDSIDSCEDSVVL